MLCCFCAYSPDKDGDETEMLADERNILIPGLTIVEEDGSNIVSDTNGMGQQKESKNCLSNFIF